MKINDKILILGARGMVGSSLVRELKAQGFNQVLAPLRVELDLKNQKAVMDYFADQRPLHVFLSAAKVGGILANNSHRADFIFENLSIQNHVFEACFQNQIEKLLFLGSSCIYPRLSPQPIAEESLLTSSLESTNEPYAIAKIAGLKLAENFRRQYGCQYYAVMPTNLYGIHDNFHPDASHVIPGLIRRLHETIQKKENEFVVWGTGRPRREFLYVDDLARACIFLMKKSDEVSLPYWINIGTGQDISIRELSELIANLMNFKGTLKFDTNKPDGTPRKLLDVSKIHALGWKHETSLRDGLKKAIEFYLQNYKHD
jgi:GDP-L-fucose synthase